MLAKYNLSPHDGAVVYFSQTSPVKTEFHDISNRNSKVNIYT